MQFQAAIFDLDGTLVNTQLHVSTIDEVVINAALQTLSEQPDQLFVQPGQIHQDPRLCGASFEDKLREMIAAGNLQHLRPPLGFFGRQYALRERIVSELSEKGAEIMLAFGGAESEVAGRIIEALQNFDMMTGNRLKIDAFPGVSETLDYLVQNGIKIAVASSNTNSRIRGRLKSANLGHFGDNIWGADGVYIRRKPAPDVYQDAAYLLKVSSASCIGVDDSIQGVQAACDAGMYVVGVVQDPSKDYEIEKAGLLDNGANIVCRNFGEVQAELAVRLGLLEAGRDRHSQPGLDYHQPR